MLRFIIPLAILAPIAHADITYIQETLPGVAGIPSNRGYVKVPAGTGFTQVIPTKNGIQDTSRPGYLVGPTIHSGPTIEPIDIGQSRLRKYDLKYDSE
jgi:hypothetical protein